MRHLTAADYVEMPWANGRGVTVELARADGPGGLLWRLSMAAVVEDGAFSILPGIDRVLTVIEGPEFDLVGDGVRLRADPLVPVAFSGDLRLEAVGVSGPVVDFNVMVRRGMFVPMVAVVSGRFEASGDAAGVFALEAVSVEVEGAVVPMARHDFLLGNGGVIGVASGAVIVVTLVAGD